jgi:hypothetical protein
MGVPQGFAPVAIQFAFKTSVCDGDTGARVPGQSGPVFWDFNVRGGGLPGKPACT